MSRHIDFQKPLSEDDKKYLLTRPDGEALIKINDSQFGHLDDDGKQDVADQKDADDQVDADEQKELQELQTEGELTYDDSVIDQVDPLTVAELRAALDKRNLKKTGDKEELQDRLLAVLQEEKDGSNTVPTTTE